MRTHKKAVSALVATVLLILITVAAVGIIWGAIMPMLAQGMDVGRACMNARLQINTQQGYSCFNTTGPTPNRVLIQVERGAEDFIPLGLQLVVTGGGQSKVYTVRNKQTGVGSVSELPANFSGVTLDVPGINEARTYFVDSGMTTTSEISVAPIVKVGNTEKICDVSSRAAVTQCRAG